MRSNPSDFRKKKRCSHFPSPYQICLSSYKFFRVKNNYVRIKLQWIVFPFIYFSCTSFKGMWIFIQNIAQMCWINILRQTISKFILMGHFALFIYCKTFCIFKHSFFFDVTYFIVIQYVWTSLLSKYQMPYMKLLLTRVEPLLTESCLLVSVNNH